MFTNIFWKCLVWTATIFFLHCTFGEKSHKMITDFQCPFNPNAYHSSNHLKYLKNCDAKINGSKIHFKCEAYAASAMDLNKFPNSTAGLLVTDYMETFEDVDEILTRSSNTSCLKFVASRIQKANFQDSEILRKYNEYTCKIPPETFIPIMLIQLMDMKVTFSDDYALGSVSFNKTCLQIANSIAHNQNNANVSVNVSSCLTSVEVVLRFLPSVTKFRVLDGLTMKDLFSKDFLHVILVLMSELFFIGYNYNVPSLTFKTGLFKFIPTDAMDFLSQKNVSTVVFKGNDILSIRNGDIPLMESLLTLDLSNCQIEFIDENAFDGALYLNKLNLRDNKLKELSLAFNNLHNLNALILRDNEGSNQNEFRYRSLDSNSNLQRLDLSNMVLMNFWENLGNLSKLEYLKLSNCSLQNVPNINLSYFLPNLIHLNLSNNNLHNLSAFAFSGFSKLKSLDLSYNYLNNFQYEAVIDVVPKLKIFSLKANGIFRFSKLVLNDDSKLEILDISLNRIISWNETMVNSSNTGLKLNLIGNNITEVNSHMQRDFSSFKLVKLAENPFDCKSCVMKDFIEWLKIANTSTDFSTSPYTCFFPKEDFKKRITKVVLELCIEQVFDWITNVVIPTTTISVLLIIASVIFFIYRWHFTYLIYLLRAKLQKHLRQNNGVLFKYDAFVSYCTGDRDWVVNHLIPSIENQDPKLHLCIHERDFEAGETIMNNVIECIDSSHRSIFILSQQFIESQWCQWELQMAQHKLFEDKRDVLILIMLSEINEKKIPKILRHLISKRTYLKWPENENGQQLFWARLRDAIGKCQCVVR